MYVAVVCDVERFSWPQKNLKKKDMHKIYYYISGDHVGHVRERSRTIKETSKEEEEDTEEDETTVKIKSINKIKTQPPLLYY